MDAGRLNKRVRIERQAITRDEFGGEVVVWTLLAEVWAVIEPLSGRELIAAQAAQSQASVRVTVRHRAGVDATMRIVHKTHVFELTAPPIDVKGAGKWLELMCKEVNGAS